MYICVRTCVGICGTLVSQRRLQMTKARDRQVSFYADEDVHEFILGEIPSGRRSSALNDIVREHMHKRGKRKTSDLEGWLSWLEILADRDNGGNELAGDIAELIDGYYREMHEAYIDGWKSQSKPVPIDHRPCKYCGDDV